MTDPSITMIRESLDAIPQFDLPAPLSFRWYRPGDAEAWLDIHREADLHNDITPALYERSFGTDADELARRQCFMTDGEGRAIGTGTAWFGELEGERMGRVHWIAIRPEMQGRGLSRPLLSAVLTRMKELGHERAYLTTRSYRHAAISTYRSFGFRPYVRGETDAAAWRSIGWTDL